MSLVQSDQFSNAPSSSDTPFSSSSSSSSTHSSSPPSSGGTTSTTKNPSSSSSSSSSDLTGSSAPGTVGTTPTSQSSKSDTTANGSTSTGAQKAGSGQSGTTTPSSDNNAVDNAVVPDTTPAVTTTSSSIPAPTPTSTSSSTHLPTSTSTSSTALPTSTRTSTYATSTTSSSLPAPTPTATSTSATASHTHTVFTSTNAGGSVVVLTSTIFQPTSTSLPGTPGHSLDTETTGPNIGAIIGGIAGGLVGVILLTWLILIPIRKRAALKKEVDWMAFGSENDHHNNDSNNDSIYRTPRAGVGELEAKALDSPDLYAMSDLGSGAHQGTLYSHLDANGSSNWAGAGSGGVGSYNVANNVVGEAPPGQQYDANYAAYYPAVAVQQQQQQYGNYPSYSDHGSPEMGAQRHAGQQQPWPTTSTSSHGHQPNVPINNYPFAPPTVASSHSMQRNASLNDRVLLSHGDSFSASTATAHDNNPLSRSTSGQAGMPPLPGKQAPNAQTSGHGPSKSVQSDDCALAYVLDDTEDTPIPDKGAIPGLHLANPDR